MKYKSTLLLLAVLFAASAAFPEGWSGTQLQPHLQNSYNWKSTDATGLSSAIDATQCPSAVIGFDPGTSGSATLLACPLSTSAAAACSTVTSLAASLANGERQPVGLPWLKVNRLALPAAGPGATLYLYCGQEASGGGAPSWLSGLTLADPKMGQAVSDATYEWHHWSMKDTHKPFEPVSVTEWATEYAAAGLCQLGQTPYIFKFVYDFAFGETCESGVGTNDDYGSICQCRTIVGGAGFGAGTPTDVVEPHFWSNIAADGGGGVGTIDDYATDLQFLAYPRPMLRLDPLTPNSVVTAEAVNHSVFFQSRDNPVFYYEITPWNYNAAPANMLTDTIGVIAFFGWRKDDVTVSTPGFNYYVTSTPSIPAEAVVAAEIVDGFGVLWSASKWYAVWIKDGVLAQWDVILDPVVAFGSVSNYLTQHMGGTVAFAIQTDIDNKSGGRKSGAYQVTNFTDSTNSHSTFVPFAMGTGGSPDSGFGDVGGQGHGYHRIVAATSKNLSSTIVARFFVSQMDVVK